MKNKLLFCALLSMVLSEIRADDVVKGKVGFSLYPTIEDIADAYEKSETDDLRCVAADLVSSRNVERKKYSLANAAEVELQALPGFKVLRKVKVNVGFRRFLRLWRSISINIEDCWKSRSLNRKLLSLSFFLVYMRGKGE